MPKFTAPFKAILLPLVCSLCMVLLNTGCQTTSETATQQQTLKAEQHDSAKNHSPTFERLLSLAKEVNPTVNLEGARTRFDALVKILKPRVKAAPTPREKIAEVSKVLFVEQGMRVVPDALGPTVAGTLDQSKNGLYSTDNLLMPKLLELKSGYCVSFVSLYVALGEVLGLPLYPVLVPAHVFVRYDDGKDDDKGRNVFNIETLAAGQELTDAEYREDYQVSQAVEKKGYHLTTLRAGPDALAALHWANLAVIAISANELDAALERIGRFEKVFPDSPMAHHIRALVDLERKDFAAVRKALTLVLRDEPINPGANFMMGYLELGNGQSEKARTFFEAAFQGGNVIASAYAFALWQQVSKKGAAPKEFRVPAHTSRDAVSTDLVFSNPKGWFGLTRKGQAMIYLEQRMADFTDNLVIERGALPAGKTQQAFVEEHRINSRARMDQSSIVDLQRPACSYAFRSNVGPQKNVISCVKLIFSAQQVIALTLSTLGTKVGMAEANFAPFVAEAALQTSGK